MRAARSWRKQAEESKPAAGKAENQKCITCGKESGKVPAFIECEFPGDSLIAKYMGTAPNVLRAGFCASCIWPRRS